MNKTTGYSPYYLMFGRSPRLPIDLVFGIKPNEEEKPKLQVSYQKYVEEWEQAMNQAFNIVKKHSCSSGVYNKVYYNKNVRGVEINVGDKVLLRNHAEKGGTGKLRSYWKDNVYLVVAKDAEIPVYTIRPEVGSCRERRVHRNNIMSSNLVLPKQIEVKKKIQKRTTRNNENILAQSESDEEIIVVIHEDTFGNEEEEMVNVLKILRKRLNVT